MPTEYVDHSQWFTQKDEENKKNWIGHGYYWKRGEGTKDSYSFFDYDCFEDNFIWLKKAKVLVADYELIKRDFPFL